MTMTGRYKGFDWEIERRKDLDIIGDKGMAYMFKALRYVDGKEQYHRESLVKRYSKEYKRVMYDNSFDTFLCKKQIDVAKYLCDVFDNLSR
jgi:hypothetical protein